MSDRDHNEAPEQEESSGESVEEVEISEVREEVDRQAPPLIALVGRPNVGKSRMFNRMTGTRFAIVEDEPGVTRDRQYGTGTWEGRPFQVVDTGGFDPQSEDAVLAEMRRQATLAIEEADVIFFLMDARAGILPGDREIAQLLRGTDKLVVPIANKIDSERQYANIAEFYELGFEEVLPLSAEHGLGYHVVMDQVLDFLPKESARREDDPTIRVAVVGKPNAGKSTLINQLLGTERLLTSDRPGTTRDAVNTRLRRGDRDYLFIDTAGIRRKRSIDKYVEKVSVVQAFKALDRADVAVMVIDAEQGVTKQDQRICGLAHDKGCALILMLNKWDKIEKDHRTAQEYAEDLRYQLQFATYAPIITVSAKTGQRVHRTFDLIEKVFKSYTERVSTSSVNDFLEKALRYRSPPQKQGRSLKIYYGSQVATRPPTFMFVVNKPEMMHFSYERYLNNSLRAAFGFEGAPIKIFFRKRGSDADPNA
jgi:GTP-binding protein